MGIYIVPTRKLLLLPGTRRPEAAAACTEQPFRLRQTQEDENTEVYTSECTYIVAWKLPTLSASPSAKCQVHMHSNSQTRPRPGDTSPAGCLYSSTNNLPGPTTRRRRRTRRQNGGSFSPPFLNTPPLPSPPVRVDVRRGRILGVCRSTCLHRKARFSITPPTPTPPAPSFYLSHLLAIFRHRLQQSISSAEPPKLLSSSPIFNREGPRSVKRWPRVHTDFFFLCSVGAPLSHLPRRPVATNQPQHTPLCLFRLPWVKPFQVRRTLAARSRENG